MKPYSAFQTAANGDTYSVRYLLDAEELQALQAAGLVPMDAAEIVSLQSVVDGLIARFERDCYRAAGGVVQ